MPACGLASSGHWFNCNVLWSLDSWGWLYLCPSSRADLAYYSLVCPCSDQWLQESHVCQLAAAASWAGWNLEQWDLDHYLQAVTVTLAWRATLGHLWTTNHDHSNIILLMFSWIHASPERLMASSFFFYWNLLQNPPPPDLSLLLRLCWSYESAPTGKAPWSWLP